MLHLGTPAGVNSSRMTVPDPGMIFPAWRRWAFLPADQLLSESEQFPEDGAQGSFQKALLFAIACSRSGKYEAAWSALLTLLRRTPGSHPFQYPLRSELVNVLLRVGDMERAERAIRKSMSRLSFASLDLHYKCSFKAVLGRVYRRKGWLSLAADLYRETLCQRVPWSSGWVANLGNLIHAELRADRLDNVRSLLAELEAPGPGKDSPFSRWQRECCWLTYCIELGEAAESAAHLERLGASPLSRETERDRLLFQNYAADVALVSKDFAGAAERYRNALEEPFAHRFRFDLVPCLARGLAESLHGLGMHAAASEQADLAIRTGERGDRLEELRGLHVLAKCQWALSRRQEARELFLRAQALHVGLEFARERRRLAETLAALGVFESQQVPALPAPARESPRLGADPPAFELEDGRRFMTLDRKLAQAIRLAAESELPVLIDGETGTGKELVAKLIHELGPRSKRPFVVVDCSTLPDGLMESELFGAARGAFTGCTETREGIVARANGGTLLLDELTELSVQAQAKLLRLLQEGTYRRVGDPTPRRVDVRFIAATNRPLADLLERRLLKPDLYHRLNGHQIRLRPLRERRQEIAMIALQTARRMGLVGIDEEALALLEQATWSGNVRELEMVLGAAGQGARPGDTLKAEALRARLQVPEPHAQNGALRESRLAAERSMLRKALDAYAGNVSAAARSMGLSRQSFYKALKRTGAREQV